MSSENFVRTGAGMVGIVFQVNVTACLFTKAQCACVARHIPPLGAVATLVPAGLQAPGRENLMAKKMEGLEQLLVEDLQDLFDAEKQLVRALPKMAKSATDQELENAFRQHLEVTKGQVQRLEQVFESMDMRAKSKPCHGMKGLVEEGQEL